MRSQVGRVEVQHCWGCGLWLDSWVVVVVVVVRAMVRAAVAARARVQLLGGCWGGRMQQVLDRAAEAEVHWCVQCAQWSAMLASE